jgi:uncharacterized membrane protein
MHARSILAWYKNMVAYKLFLIDFVVSSVYTEEVMPPKRAKVSA